MSASPASVRDKDCGLEIISCTPILQLELGRELMGVSRRVFHELVKLKYLISRSCMFLFACFHIYMQLL